MSPWHSKWHILHFSIKINFHVCSYWFSPLLINAKCVILNVTDSFKKNTSEHDKRVVRKRCYYHFRKMVIAPFAHNQHKRRKIWRPWGLIPVRWKKRDANLYRSKNQRLQKFQITIWFNYWTEKNSAKAILRSKLDAKRYIVRVTSMMPLPTEYWIDLNVRYASSTM